MKGALFVLGVVAVTSCSDPVVDDARDALGPESARVPVGPLHRPGQPCVLCHRGDGPGELVMSVAGTVYKYPDSGEPLSGAIVDLVDSMGNKHSTATNCAGNFFTQPADFEPVYPLWVSVRYGGVEVEMSSPIYREGSCAVCHTPRAGPASAGRVYFAPEQSVAFPPDGCRR